MRYTICTFLATWIVSLGTALSYNIHESTTPPWFPGPVGKFFDRFVVVYLENTNYQLASQNPDMQYLASKGITLTNYFGTTHPSEPNYIAAVGGDNFGGNTDNLTTIPATIFSIVDILEERNVSWAEYQEDMPYTGYTGYQYLDQKTQANDYVRKHNPLVMYDSVALNSKRIANIKNFTLFYEDLANDALPQWMFITPNMTNDGHDTSVATAASWARSFLAPLLTNKSFAKRTLLLLTFDESHTYTEQNRLFSLLLGDAIPTSLQGTKDANFYIHYSQLSTVEANWHLHHLGRWDVGANVFACVANATGDVLRSWDYTNAYLNTSYPGPLNIHTQEAYPAPNTTLVYAGRSVLPAIQEANCQECQESYYDGGVAAYDGMRPPPSGSRVELAAATTTASTSGRTRRVETNVKRAAGLFIILSLMINVIL